MIIVNGEYDSKDDEEDNEMPSLEDASDVEEDLKEVNYNDFLVVRCTLSTQTKVEEDEQCDNIFHAICRIKGKVCCLIIDGGSYINAASTLLLEKLNLLTLKLPRPYNL